jgi:hypothetical protein
MFLNCEFGDLKWRVEVGDVLTRENSTWNGIAVSTKTDLSTSMGGRGLLGDITSKWIGNIPICMKLLNKYPFPLGIPEPN